MRVIAIINQKGGCGKTTTSINLSASLATLGERTLLVDLDPQGHCAVGLAVPEEQIQRSIFDTLIEPGDGHTARLSEVTWQIAENFDLAPSTLKLAAFEQLFSGRPGRESRLAAALTEARPKYNWAILDCPPSVGLITFNALMAADEVIVPVETGFFSLHGLTKMMQTIAAMKEKAGKNPRVRILPTLYDTRTKLAREVLSDLRAKFKNELMESTVNFNTKLKEAASFGQPITEYDPGSRGYKDFQALARELMGQRPAQIEPANTDHGGAVTRPVELVQRAKALANLTNLQFGRNLVTIQQPLNQAPAAVETDMLLTRSSRTATLPPPAAPPVSTGVASAVATAQAVQTAAPKAAVSAEPRAAEPKAEVKPKPELTTEQKIEAFYGVRQTGAATEFAVKIEKAGNVQIAGDFNGWSPAANPMKPERGGRWSTTLSLPSGRYRYRLVVDGQWLTDPHNTHVETNQFGELNNIVEVA